MNDKKQLLVKSALRLFYENGINSVGINEILQVSGVAKKTLYNHFKSKEELIIATLKLRDSIFLCWLEAALKNSSSNSELVNRLFFALTLWFQNKTPQLSHFRGCFFINTAVEYSDQDCDISRYCREHKFNVRNIIANAMTTENETLLDMICLLKEGAIISAYVSHDLQAAEKCIPLLLPHLQESR
jgi:AcrR family transcriptional regulator